MLIWGCLRAKFAWFEHTAQVVVCTISTAALIFGLGTSVLTFGSYTLKIRTVSVANAVGICIIGKALLFVGLCRQKISCFVANLNIDLRVFCANFVRQKLS